MEFQNYMYAPSFIESNAAQFLDLNWIEVLALRKFLEQKISIHASGSNTLTISVKSELQLISLSRVSGAVKLRTLNQGGREILELISESEAEESDPDCDVEVTAALMRTSSRFSSTIPQSDAMDTDDRGPDEGGTYTSYLGVPFLLKSHLDARQEAEEVPTALVIDLADERYDITDNDGELLPVDCIIIPFS
ncbi:hypothetical protein B0H13DRAFT_2268255 [Mycena leptocephala]|nr:hypothetical protein B0H13DRAFT_2268255 [Mycena leptocephala]